MSSDDLTFDFLRQRAALDLSPQQQAEFQRLVKVLRFGSRFQMIFVEIGDAGLRGKLISRLDDILQPAHMTSVQIDLGQADFTDVAAFERWLRDDPGAKVDVIHIVNTEAWLDDERLHGLNIRREALAHTLECKLVFWMSPSMLDKVAQHAADLWSWRSGVYSLQEPPASAIAPLAFTAPRSSDEKSFAERSQRIGALRQTLRSTEDQELRLPLLDELASLFVHMGAYEAALLIRQEEELPIYRRLGMRREEAHTLRQIAEIFSNQGRMDAALAILANEVLPASRRFGEQRMEAEVQLHIAFLLCHQGKLSESLHVCNDIVLPLARTLLDDALETKANEYIAEVYFKQQRYDDALDIQLHKVLPAWLKVNYLRQAAVAYGHIAQILTRMGRYDEALSWRSDKELPLHLYHNDAITAAICKSEIASIFMHQGQLDEALKLLEDEVLPVMAQIDDIRSIAVTRGRIADIFAMQGKLAEALQLYQSLCMPIFRQMNDIPGIAGTAMAIGTLQHRIGNDVAARDCMAEAKEAYCRLEEPLASYGIEVADHLLAKLPSLTGQA